jgi:hypothetical protein
MGRSPRIAQGPILTGGTMRAVQTRFLILTSLIVGLAILIAAAVWFSNL